MERNTNRITCFSSCGSCLPSSARVTPSHGTWRWTGAYWTGTLGKTSSSGKKSCMRTRSVVDLGCGVGGRGGGILDREAGENKFIGEEIVYAYKVSGGSGVWCLGGGAYSTGTLGKTSSSGKKSCTRTRSVVDLGCGVCVCVCVGGGGYSTGTLGKTSSSGKKSCMRTRSVVDLGCGVGGGRGDTRQGRWGKQVHQGRNHVRVQGQWWIWGVVLGEGAYWTGTLGKTSSSGKKSCMRTRSVVDLGCGVRGGGHTRQGRWGKQVHQGRNRVCVQGQWWIWGVVWGGILDRDAGENEFIREEIVYAYKVSGGSGVWFGGDTRQGRWRKQVHRGRNRVCVQGQWWI